MFLREAALRTEIRLQICKRMIAEGELTYLRKSGVLTARKIIILYLKNHLQIPLSQRDVAIVMRASRQETQRGKALYKTLKIYDLRLIYKFTINNVCELRMSEVGRLKTYE